MKRYVAMIALTLLAGCQTATQVQEAEEAGMRSVVGLTVAEFSARTGLVPSDFYPTGSGRVFVVLGRSVTLVTPGSYGAPTVANTQTCRILLSTMPAGDGGTAENWRIVGVNYSGPCANAY